MPRQKDAFFIVWNPDGFNPKVRHDDFETASGEAQRLALANPAQSFFVMQAHRRVSTAKPLEIEDFDTDLQIPF